MNNRLPWIDLETFGLDPERDPIIEAGFKITDLDLQTLDEFNLLIWEDGIYDARYKRLVKDSEVDESAQYVLEMHNTSGLWDEARAHGVGVAQASREMLAWLGKHDIDGEDVLCGSSVQFDRGMLRAQFPEVEERFHYRNIDVSTIKELCRRYNSRVYSKAAEYTNPAKAHRSMSDLKDSVEEFEFYLDNFLHVHLEDM